MPQQPGRASQVLTPNQIAGAAQRAGFLNLTGLGDSQVVIMVAIALAESGGDMNALNASGRDESYGLWQINMKGGLGPARRTMLAIPHNDWLYDPGVNAQAALQIYRGQGLSAWSVYNDGKYRQHLQRARDGAANPAYDYPRGAPINAPGAGDINIVPGGKVPDLLMDALQPLLDWLAKMGLRTAGFIGGGVLVAIAIVLYVRSKTK